MNNDSIYNLIDTFKEQTNQTCSIINESNIPDNRIKIDSMYFPYFTLEEVDMLKDYYHSSEGNKNIRDYFESAAIVNHVLKTNYYDNDKNTISNRIDELLDALKNTNDEDEIDNIKDELYKLNYEFEEDKGYYNENVDSIISSKFNAIKWNKDVEEIEYKFINTDNESVRDFYRQQLVDLGWNPEIEFTQENKIKAIKRIENILNEHNKNVIIDISDDIINESDVIQESYSNKNIKPIYVCLIKGNSILSKTITSVTKGDFSHAGLVLDGDFNRIYSYNLHNNFNKLGGFSIENVTSYPQENKFSVFALFVNNNDYEVIKQRVNYLVGNIKNTTYSITNLLLFPFKHLNFDTKNDNMICSQFVDSCMKMINIDITGMKSAKVSPNKLYNSMSYNTKIYKVFNGCTKDFKQNKVNNYINKIANKAKAIKECYILLEARKFPIEVNDNGDILITNPKVNLDSEYFQSHKLLVQYEKNNNLEGMKYELARLYYMNYLLEKRIYDNKYRRDKEKNIKTRARVLNDFNKYLSFVLSKEPNFNFGEYYEQSPFYPHTIEIKKTTVQKLKDILNYILYKGTKK